MRAIRAWAAACAISLAAVGAAGAQTATTDKPESGAFAPVSGQPGKDVVWVPSPQALVDRMLEMAGATPADYVIDLGSGDGRTVITAARRGIKALGVEYNPDMVALSRKAAAEANVGDRATFVQGDIFQTDFSQATVLTLFLLPDLNLKLRPTILNMKPGTRVVSNTFTMGDWTADQTIDAGGDLHQLLPGPQVDRPGEGRGHLAPSERRAEAGPEVPDADRNAVERRQGDPDRGAPQRHRDHVTAGEARYTGTVNGTRIEAKTQDGQTQTWTGVLSGS
jgi:hypothetical protein